MTDAASTTPDSSVFEPGTPAKKETASQRIERIKREKAPWSIMDDIRRYAREGFASIPPDDLGVRFRSWGLYTQGDGAVRAVKRCRSS